MGGVVVISGKNTPPATFRAALNPFLQQAKVSISGNDECRMDPTIGQYVIDTNICVSTPGKFTCTVSLPLNYLSPQSNSHCNVLKQICCLIL
jgi:hypothetical protein